MILAAANVQLKAGWQSFWSTISGTLGPITTLMTVAGVLIVVGSILRWMWDRRRGMTGQHSALLWSMAVGAVLAGPDLLMPLLLGLVDAIVNVASGILSSAGGS